MGKEPDKASKRNHRTADPRKTTQKQPPRIPKGERGFTAGDQTGRRRGAGEKGDGSR